MGKKQHEKYKHLLNVSPSSINKPYIKVLSHTFVIIATLNICQTPISEV